MESRTRQGCGHASASFPRERSVVGQVPPQVCGRRPAQPPSCGGRSPEKGMGWENLTAEGSWRHAREGRVLENQNLQTRPRGTRRFLESIQSLVVISLVWVHRSSRWTADPRVFPRVSKNSYTLNSLYLHIYDHFFSAHAFYNNCHNNIYAHQICNNH